MDVKELIAEAKEVIQFLSALADHPKNNGADNAAQGFKAAADIVLDVVHALEAALPPLGRDELSPRATEALRRGLARRARSRGGASGGSRGCASRR